jgi:hypothetical protein
MDVTPFVFAFGGGATPVAGEEAAEVFWFPLDVAAKGDLDGEFRWKRGPLVRRMPCWRFDGRVVWGLTYRILVELLEIGGAPPRE